MGFVDFACNEAVDHELLFHELLLYIDFVFTLALDARPLLGLPLTLT